MAINQMLGELSTSHTHFYTQDDLGVINALDSHDCSETHPLDIHFQTNPFESVSITMKSLMILTERQSLESIYDKRFVNFGNML